MEEPKYKIVYITPALYMAGGVERVLTLKANYFAEHFGYDITIVLTEGKGKPLFYELSDKVKVINLDINFEELWHCSFAKKIFVYLKKQAVFKKKLTEVLMNLRPDITISLLRREINFINSIKDGSKKIGELHINRANYRNFEANDSNIIKNLFAKFWSDNLVGKLKQLDRLIVLTEKDKEAWHELDNVVAIPNPLPFTVDNISNQDSKRLLFVGRYTYQKGIDLLLESWSKVEKICDDWKLDIFGDGDSTPYVEQAERLRIDMNRCCFHGRTSDVKLEFSRSSLFVCSSRFEGFGMVIAEAMACGVPVASFNCQCGPNEIITDGIDGLLASNGNVDELAEKLVLLMNDSEKRKQMSVESIKNISRFNIANIANKWQQLFGQVINTK